MRYFIFLIFFIGCSSQKYNGYHIHISSMEEISNLEKIEDNIEEHFKSLEQENLSIIGKTLSNKSENKQLSIQKIIKYHGYTLIYSLNQLKNFEDTTTYILFPKNLKGENKNTKKYKRYSKVLKLIQELNQIDEHSKASIKKYTNRFVLTKDKQVKEKKVTVETYNYTLANKIIDLFKDKITPYFFDKEGPFFITVTENIFDKKNKLSFLYLDLSTFNNSAITQVIESYKTRLVEKGDSDIDTLEGWHYHILSALTNFSDNFHLFNFSYAGDGE